MTLESWKGGNGNDPTSVRAIESHKINPLIKKVLGDDYKPLQLIIPADTYYENTTNEIYLSNKKTEGDLGDPNVATNPDSKPPEPKLSDQRGDLEKLSREQLELRVEIDSIEYQLASYQNRANSIYNEIQRLQKEQNNSTVDNSAEIDALEQDRLRLARAILLYKKYEGDYSKIGWKDKIILNALAKSLGLSSRKLFESPYFYYKQTKRKINILVNSNQYVSDPQLAELQRELSKLNSKISELEDDRQQLVTDYNDNQEELADLVDDIKKFEKAQLAATGDDTWYGNAKYRGTYAGAYSTGGSNSGRAYLNSSIRSGEHVTFDNNWGVISGNFPIETIRKSDSSGRYDYLSWGRWELTSPPQIITEPGGHVNVFDQGQWLLGEAVTDLPMNGVAVYVGEISGDHSHNGNTYLNSITGVATLNADFGTRQFTGNFNFIKNGSPWVNANIPSSQIDGDGNIYGTFNNNATPGGAMYGQFYGPEGNGVPPEAGGGWHYSTSDGTQAVGIFRTKKQ